LQTTKGNWLEDNICNPGFSGRNQQSPNGPRPVYRDLPQGGVHAKDASGHKLWALYVGKELDWYLEHVWGKRQPSLDCEHRNIGGTRFKEKGKPSLRLCFDCGVLVHKPGVRETSNPPPWTLPPARQMSNGIQRPLYISAVHIRPSQRIVDRQDKITRGWWLRLSQASLSSGTVQYLRARSLGDWYPPLRVLRNPGVIKVKDDTIAPDSCAPPFTDRGLDGTIARLHLIGYGYPEIARRLHIPESRIQLMVDKWAMIPRLPGKNGAGRLSHPNPLFRAVILPSRVAEIGSRIAQ